MRITRRQLKRIIREYGKDTLSKTRRGGRGELADPHLDYADDGVHGDIDGDGIEDLVERKKA